MSIDFGAGEFGASALEVANPPLEITDSSQHANQFGAWQRMAAAMHELPTWIEKTLRQESGSDAEPAVPADINRLLSKRGAMRVDDWVLQKEKGEGNV